MKSYYWCYNVITYLVPHDSCVNTQHGQHLSQYLTNDDLDHTDIEIPLVLSYLTTHFKITPGQNLRRKCSAWKDFRLSFWFLPPPQGTGLQSQEPFLKLTAGEASYLTCVCSVLWVYANPLVLLKIFEALFIFVVFIF